LIRDDARTDDELLIPGPVERRILGTSDLSISAIGLGTWAMGGGDWRFGWGPQKDSESLATVTQALDGGINWIDTAAAYGLGHAEIMVAKALRDIPRKERPYVFTTCGLVWDELGNVMQNLEPQSIRREAEGSLGRLGVDHIDLYRLGWPVSPNHWYGDTPGSLEEAWHTMAELQREGKARFIGVANCDVDQLDRLHQIAPVTSLHAPYSLAERGIEHRVLPYCERHTIGVIAHSTLHAGLLAGKMSALRIDALPHNDWRRRSSYFHEPRLHRALTLAARARADGAREARSPAQVATAWVLRHTAVTAASVGLRHPLQVSEATAAAALPHSAVNIDAGEHVS
jgi:aryl-alcohol dehydrogenase-like predicted oxidoreductase